MRAVAYERMYAPSERGKPGLADNPDSADGEQASITTPEHLNQLEPFLLAESAKTREARDCRECGRSFLPSSRHLRCPSCRSKATCSCGHPKQKKSKICACCRSEVREKNGNWKGGRTYHKAGYVMMLAPDHPRSGNGKYVFEHILVMEALLGRPLRPEESVHHRNGVRDDNRAENLELWIRPQPSGIRASDAVEWAVVVLSRYAPMELQQLFDSRRTALGGGGGRTRVP